MAPEQSRRKKPPRQYSVLIVPGEEGGRTRSISLTRVRLWLLAIGAVAGIILLTLAALVWSPVGSYLPIPNPELERMYGTQLREMQERLESLAEDVLLLRDYNLQLRRALGDREPGDTIRTGRRLPPPVAVSGTGGGARDTGSGEPATAVIAAAETSAADPDFTASYNAVVTNAEGFRAAFPLILPVEGFVSQEFDPARRHFGMDFAAKRGTPVAAATDGTVIFSGWTFDGGNTLMMAHGGGYVTVYKHALSLLHPELAFVRRGEPVALVGNTGRTGGGPHLHFELWKDGLPLDPREYLLTPPTLQ